MGGYEVTESCRGCLAHRCEDVCPRDAITFDEHQRAHIDKEKCVNCGRCIRELGCPALTMDGGKARIEPGLCTGCGLCSQVCPAGAIRAENA